MDLTNLMKNIPYEYNGYAVEWSGCVFDFTKWHRKKQEKKQKQLATVTVTVYDRMVITIIMENENYLGKWKNGINGKRSD